MFLSKSGAFWGHPKQRRKVNRSLLQTAVWEVWRPSVLQTLHRTKEDCCLMYL